MSYFDNSIPGKEWDEKEEEYLVLGKQMFEEEQERLDSLTEEERQKEIDEHHQLEGLRQLG